MGERVEATFTIQNTGDIVVIEPFPLAVEVERVRSIRAIPRVVRSFPAGSGKVVLQARESTTYTLIWDQRDDQGQQVSPGYYILHMTPTAAVGVGPPSLVPFLIEPPQGAIEKTLEVNQGKTVNGITVTLTRVALSASGMEIYARVWWPEYQPLQKPYIPPQHPNPPYPNVPGHILTAEAKYRFDDSPWKAAPSDTSGERPQGVDISWSGAPELDTPPLDPTPKGTKTLTFIIERIGLATYWEGPWEFRIPLE